MHENDGLMDTNHDLVILYSLKSCYDLRNKLLQAVTA